MSVLDDVIVNAKSAADAVGKTASKLVDISKLRISAAELNAEIGKQYEKLGSAVYEARKGGSDFEQTAAEITAAIDDLKEQLDAVNAQLFSARDKTVCSNCGQENSSSAVYCDNCGHKLDDPVPEKKDNTGE